MISIRRAFIYGATTSAVLSVLAACGSASHTGSISPTGTSHGLYYCSYTPTGDGIKISRKETVPCVVNDTRSTKDRKKVKPTTGTSGRSSYGSPTSRTVKTGKTKTSTASKPRPSGKR